MSFVKKTWKDRISQFPNRRTINDGYVTKQVTVGRDEGVVTEEGTPYNATEMNDLENRIYAAIEEGGGGGGGAGTYNYTELFNKPRINNHELNGNQSAADLGIASNANELPIESGSSTNTKGYIDSGLSDKADSSMLGDITGVTITCPRCPIASISNLKVKKAGDMVILGANLTFGASQAGNVYLLTSLFGNNTYCSGTLYDNATDKTYLLGKGTSTSIWVREGANPVLASEFSNKSNIIMTVYGTL